MPDTAQSTERAARRVRLFRRFAALTIGVVYVLILLGGIVRATGSGLGCPDWPRCFGRWVPPTEISQLPPDYKTRYAEDGLPPEKVIFSPFNTWVEYLNRLAGAVTGIVIALTVLLAWRAFGLGSSITLLSLAAMLLTGIQGWLGAKVVSTALMPTIITLHNVLAQVIVYLLIAGWWLSRRNNLAAQFTTAERWQAVGALALVVLQFYLGLAVRQHVDSLEQMGVPRQGWAAGLDLSGSLFWLHRLSSSVVFGSLVVGFLWYTKERSGIWDEGSRLHLAGVAMVIANIMLGFILKGQDMPVWAQPLHLLLGSVVLGVYFSLVMVGFLSRKAT